MITTDEIRTLTSTGVAPSLYEERIATFKKIQELDSEDRKVSADRVKVTGMGSNNRMLKLSEEAAVAASKEQDLRKRLDEMLAQEV